jgi:PhzF family phenazine biosynthesis protein
MSSIPCWQVDAFTNRPFGGNPAAICWLEQPADPAWMQSVAEEMNLSETAFVRRLADGLELRWFTPIVEVDLCGHATLATAHAIWTSGLAPLDQPLRFHTKSGLLTCTRAGDFIELDFPAMPAKAVTPPGGLIEALGVEPVFVGQSKFDYLVVLGSAEAVRNTRPDFAKLGQIQTRGVIVTARSADPQFDLISRFFAPAVGVNEDPVCGSAHCCLAPYWAEQLGKTELMAFQASNRGGVLRLRLNGNRVILGGQAVTVWQGNLF